MTLPGEEFIRRFLIHVLPDGFHRIRYFGFLGNCHRARKLALCRELLGMAPAGPATEPPADYRDRFEALTGQSLRTCPHCHTGVMVVVDCIARPKNLPADSGYIMTRYRPSSYVTPTARQIGVETLGLRLHERLRTPTKRSNPACGGRSKPRREGEWFPATRFLAGLNQPKCPGSTHRQEIRRHSKPIGWAPEPAA